MDLRVTSREIPFLGRLLEHPWEVFWGVSLLSVVFVRGLLLWDYYASGLLVHDDTIYIGTFMVGEHFDWPDAQVAFYVVLKLLASGGSDVPPKIFLLLIQAVIALGFYRIVFRFGGSHFVAVGLAILATCYPMSVDQTYFMSGAHPAAATAVFIVFCVLFVESLFRGWVANKPFYLIFLAGQGVLLYICGFSSPTFTLMPLILVACTVSAILVEPVGRKLSGLNIILIILSFVPMGIYYAAIHGHHYSEYIGWSELSLKRILDNFSTSLGYIFADPFEQYPTAAVGYITGFGVLLVACLASMRHAGKAAEKLLNGKLIAAIVVLLLSSAMTFGPSSIVVQFHTRYVVAPALIGFLLISVVLAVLIRSAQENSSAYSMAIQSGVALLALVSLVHGSSRTRDEIRPFLEANRLIKTAVSTVPINDGAQILILLPKGYVTPTAGYNHWSTWYLRALTGNKKVIGLIGAGPNPDRIYASELFVEKYRNRGEEYWGVSAGRSFRIPMKGLERGRPLYVLAPDEEARLKLKPMVFWNEDELGIVPPGRSPASATVKPDETNICETEGGVAGLLADAVTVVGDPVIPGRSSFQPLVELSLTADMTNFETEQVQVVPGRLSMVSLRLVTDMAERNTSPLNSYTNTQPAMPMMGPDYSIYVTEGRYSVRARDKQWIYDRVPAQSGQALQVQMVGCPGDFGLVEINNEFAGVIANASFSGTWTLGKGFMDRYWAGEIESFSVGTLPE